MAQLFTYYLYSFNDEHLQYCSNSTSLYAYTDDKEIKRNFEKVRNMKMFHKEKVKLTKSQVSILTSMYRNLRLLEYRFLPHISFPITIDEKMMIEYIGNKIVNYDLYTSAFNINPEIFNKDIYELLKDISYVDSYYYNETGVIGTTALLKPNFLVIFIKNFGKTLNNEV